MPSQCFFAEGTLDPVGDNAIFCKENLFTLMEFALNLKVKCILSFVDIEYLIRLI